jgi:hypothetical protein
MPTRARPRLLYLDTPGGAMAMVDRHADRLPAGALHQRRQVAVHVVEVGQVEEGLALEQLDAAAGVGRVVAQHARADRVGPAEAQRLLPESWRFTRQPANSLTSARRHRARPAAWGCRPDRSGRRRPGWRSRAPRAALTPLRTAVLWPLWLTGGGRRAAPAFVALQRAQRARVSSLEQVVDVDDLEGDAGRATRRRSRRQRRDVVASLCTGTTTDSCGFEVMAAPGWTLRAQAWRRAGAPARRPALSRSV